MELVIHLDSTEGIWRESQALISKVGGQPNNGAVVVIPREHGAFEIFMVLPESISNGRADTWKKTLAAIERRLRMGRIKRAYIDDLREVAHEKAQMV